MQVKGFRARPSALAVVLSAVLFAFVLFTAAPARAQSSGLVRGTVADPSGAVVVGATVVLQSASSSFKRTAQTDQQGAYQFYNVPFADYTISVSAAGFAETSGRITVSTGAPLEKTFTLTPAGASEEVTVTDSSAGDRIEGADLSVAATTIQSLAVVAPSKQLEGALLQLPGIVADENGRFHPRGAHNQASFVVDGVQVSDQMSTVFSNNIDAQNVEGVNLVSGIVPPEYGNKVAAVINVSSKSGLGLGRDVFGSLSFGVGSFSQWDTSAQVGGQIGSDFGYFFSASHTQSHRYLDPPFQNATAFGLVAGGEGFHNDGDGQRYFGRLDWTKSQSDIFKVTLSGGRSLFDVPNLPSQQLAGQHQQQFIRDVSVSPSWLHVFNANWSMNVAPYYRTSNADLISSPFDTPLEASQERHLTSYGLNASATYTGHGHTAKFGTDSFVFPIRENFSFAIADPTFNDPSSPSFNPNLLPYDLTRGGDFFRFSDRATGHEYSVYAQDTWTRGGLTVGGGVRFDNYRLLQVEHAWSPRFGVAYRFPTGTSLRFAYNRVFQTPSNENLLLASSDDAASLIPPDQLAELGGVGVRLLPGERGDWFEAGVSQPLGSVVDLDLSVYSKGIDFIADDSQFLNTGVVFPVALARGTVRGVELHGDVKRHAGFSGTFALTLSRARGVLPIVGGLLLGDEAVAGAADSGREFPLDHDEPFAASFLAAWDSAPRLGLFATLDGRYDSGLPTEIDDPSAIAANPDLAPGLALLDFTQDPLRVKSRFVLNASVGKELFRREHYAARVQVSGLNLTNQDRLYNFLSAFSGTHYIPPRSIAARLSFEF
jgi:outer membrane receptor protein involved in Fe transport